MKRARCSFRRPDGGVAGAAFATDIPMDTVVLGGLDKVAARVNTFKDRVGQPVKFGTLEIIARTCVTHPPEEQPENAAFRPRGLSRFTPQGQPRAKVFSGWMFASSPALSALDHPVYDIWVLRCENSASRRSRRPSLPDGIAAIRRETLASPRRGHGPDAAANPYFRLLRGGPVRLSGRSRDVHQ